MVDGAATAVVLLLFPTGLLLSRRWRWILWLLGVAVVLVIAGLHTSPAVFAVCMSGFLIGTAGSIASLILRFRHSTEVERLQLKQLVFASCLILATMALSAFSYQDSVFVQSLLALAFLALPVAIGVAILRHHLYDIDIVVNRTLVYGSLTLTLAATLSRHRVDSRAGPQSVDRWFLTRCRRVDARGSSSLRPRTDSNPKGRRPPLLPNEVRRPTDTHNLRVTLARPRRSFRTRIRPHRRGEQDGPTQPPEPLATFLGLNNRSPRS